MAGIEHWNERYAADGYLFGEEPNAFLRSQAPRLRPGWSALAVADGEGRNGVWMAEQGLAVTAVEASPVALSKAQALAARRGVALTTVEADLADWTVAPTSLRLCGRDRHPVRRARAPDPHL